MTDHSSPAAVPLRSSPPQDDTRRLDYLDTLPSGITINGDAQFPSMSVTPKEFGSHTRWLIDQDMRRRGITPPSERPAQGAAAPVCSECAGGATCSHTRPGSHPHSTFSPAVPQGAAAEPTREERPCYCESCVRGFPCPTCRPATSHQPADAPAMETVRGTLAALLNEHDEYAEQWGFSPESFEHEFGRREIAAIRAFLDSFDAAPATTREEVADDDVRRALVAYNEWPEWMTHKLSEVHIRNDSSAMGFRRVLEGFAASRLAALRQSLASAEARERSTKQTLIDVQEYATKRERALRLAGLQLSNCAYNLAQNDRLDERTRDSLRASYRRWDDAIRAAALSPSPSEPAR